MRLLLAVAALAAAAALPAAAQVSNSGIAVESGLSAPAGAGGAPAALLAVSASRWIEGDVEGFARLAFGSADGTVGRAAVPALAGTVGLRVSLGRAPLRPQAFLDAGWANVEVDGAAASRATFGLGVALEWFPAGEVSVAPRAALRLTGGAAAAELALALGGYF